LSLRSPQQAIYDLALNEFAEEWNILPSSRRPSNREHALTSSTVVSPIAIPRAPDDFSGTWTSSVFGLAENVVRPAEIHSVSPLRDDKEARLNSEYSV
jgi:hypothetical protein